MVLIMQSNLFGKKSKERPNHINSHNCITQQQKGSAYRSISICLRKDLLIILTRITLWGFHVLKLRLDSLCVWYMVPIYLCLELSSFPRESSDHP